MGQVRGKGGGYYGCLSASKEACANKLLVRRRLVERRVLEAVRERISDASSIHYVLTRVETEVRRLHANLPQSIRLTRSRLDAEERRVANFIEFIGDGKGTRALGQALSEAEGRVEELRADLGVLESTAGAIFEAPLLAWVAERVASMGDLLRRQTARSALVLRRILGPVRLCAVRPEVGRPYYRVETALEILDLLDEASEGGSNWLQQWRRGESTPRPKAHTGVSRVPGVAKHAEFRRWRVWLAPRVTPGFQKIRNVSGTCGAVSPSRQPSMPTGFHDRYTSARRTGDLVLGKGTHHRR
jgi:hypothetical protein